MPFCARCTELNITPLLIGEGRGEQLPHFSEIIVQRLVFDHESPTRNRECPACDYLTRNSRRFVLTPGRIMRLGTIEGEVSTPDFSPSFEFMGGRLLRRNRNKAYGNGVHILGNSAPSNSCDECWAGDMLDRSSLLVAPRPDYARAAAWLKHCSESHTQCRPQSPEALSSMSLIDVSTRTLVPYPSGKSDGTDYLALSYVWGGVRQRTVGLGRLPDCLPGTIEDSIKVVGELGQRYLWVDSICIDRKFPNSPEVRAVLDTVI